MRYIFQQSQIMEAGDPVDPRGSVIKIKATTEQKARKQLAKHKTPVGRVWVLVRTEMNESSKRH